MAVVSSVICSIFFLVRYRFCDAVPWGTDIIGWRGWADQGSYLQSAIDFSKLAFNPSQHRYPPLYAFLAVPFLKLYSTDPFIFVNIACVAASTYLLIRIFEAVAGGTIAAILAVTLLMGVPLIATSYVVPWTSTIVSPLVIGCIYMLQRSELRPATIGQSFLFALLIGLIFLARPLDGIIVGAALVPFWCWPLRRSWSGLIKHGLCLALGGAIGPALFFANNLVIFHSLVMPYMVEHNDRLRLTDIPEKFVSIFLDSKALYIDAGQTILNAFPWFIVCMGATASLLVLGKGWVRATAVLIVLMFAIYLSFDDLFPTGLIRYANYHYFKWSIVLAGMLVIPLFADFLRSSALHRALIGVIFLGVAVVSCLHINTTMTATNFDRVNNSIRIDTEKQGAIDFLDFSRASGDWVNNYYFGGADVMLDGRQVKYSREMKMIPSTPFLKPMDGSEASFARLLFIRPVRGKELRLNLDKLSLSENSTISIGTYGFGLGYPVWLQ